MTLALKIAVVLIGLAAAFLAYLFVLGLLSRSGTPPGIDGGSLAACPDKPNCVCSEVPVDSARFIEPLPTTGESLTQTLAALTAAIDALGGRIESAQGEYLAATFASSLFRFVDDVEFRVDVDAGIVQVRSASRVGHSDLGANRKRVEAIREYLLER